MNKQRIEFIDLAKGICISLVVLLHVYGDSSGTFIKMMNLFRMPLYFVLSGLFFKTYDGLFPFLKKKINKLLIPFLFTFSCVILPTTVLLSRKAGLELSVIDVLGGVDGKLNLGINGASWFLLCLFFVNAYFYLIFLLSRQHIAGICVLSCLCGVAGYVLSLRAVWLPMWMDSALTAVPFFLMGYVLRNYSNLLSGLMMRRNYMAGVCSLVLLGGVYLYDEWSGAENISYGDNEFDISIVSLYLGGFTGTYFVLMVSKWLRYVPVVTYIGRYSIVVLQTHLLYLFTFRNMLYQLGIEQGDVWLNGGVFVIIMLLEIPTIWFCVRYLPYCFAQNDLWK